jgi:hypothetical protein
VVKGALERTAIGKMASEKQLTNNEKAKCQK